MKRILFILVPALFAFNYCISQSTGNKKIAGKMNSENNTSASSQNQQWMEGKDYMQYERVRLMDKTGFTEPQEAYSLLLPKGWKSDGNIIWIGPGNTGAGTYRHMISKSADGNYLFEMLPDVIYAWSNNPGAMQSPQNNFSRTGPPMNAETYLRQVFARELGGAQVVSVESNQAVIDQMRQSNSKAVSELMQYGAAQVNFDQTAVNAKVKWNDGSEALVTLGITIIATTVPNVYTGGSSQQFTTMATKRTVFKYPAAKSQEAKQLFSVIMSSFHTNPKWNDAVNNFWFQSRQQSHIVHVGRIKLIDEQTRRIGEQTIRNGEQRLKNMDAQAKAHAQSQAESRTWEQSQNSQDRMHTEFVKTIREVENFRDENGKWEMTAGYEHAWSRGDGTSFILSNDPNFNAASVFQDQNWKQMKKVR